MGATRWGKIFNDIARTINREVRITFTPTPKPDKWVFVVGCYNSGTTLLAEMLGEHPKISALPSEGQYLTDQLPRDHEIGLSRMWVKREDLYRLTDTDEGPDVERIKREWAMRLDRRKPIFLEKTPANSARMLWLQKNFENAHFIAIVRNGFAVAEGITRKGKPTHRNEGWPLEMAAYQWARSNEVLFEDATHVKNFHWLRYEDLTENPQTCVDRICEFLGMAGNEYIDLSQEWSIHERSEPISNLNSKSFDRLSPDDRAIIESVAGPMLRKLSYLEK